MASKSVVLFHRLKYYSWVPNKRGVKTKKKEGLDIGYISFQSVLFSVYVFSVFCLTIFLLVLIFVKFNKWERGGG